MALLSNVRNRVRRRRAARRYLDDLSRDLQAREMGLDYLESTIAEERAGFHERIVSDVLGRTEAIIEELGRRIEDVAARTGRDLAELETELAELREKVNRLRAQEGPSGNGDRRGDDLATSRAEGAPPPASAAE
jgi:chromosome segregation ATPase